MKINVHENIAIRLMNEKFEVISYYDGNLRHIYDHYMEKIMTTIKDPFNPEYPFLTTIDEYDNTIFNWVQVPRLINELRRVGVNDEDIEFSYAVENVIEYLNTISSLYYIQFLGD